MAKSTDSPNCKKYEVLSMERCESYRTHSDLTATLQPSTVMMNPPLNHLHVEPSLQITTVKSLALHS
ncbi:hypothetical protein LOK49_LG05G02741 [Camellia lanceoleosa]|uniref:Uncharacterized protein n=1 Tax=Camellia lanceoleosa TaxID=1840588 RepID=A0ACC0HS89_9ERIC|nr:hypothetical protein LOK49_LG05G02741 [Camellia lanceoleosa]